VILEKEDNEDSAIFKKEINTLHMDMMGHVIYILHTFFILVSWNVLVLERVDDVSPSSLWSYNQSGFPLKEEVVALHQKSEQVFEKE